jgi:hypothetical protein
MLGMVVSMVTTFVLPPTRFNLLMLGALALSIGLVFYFIVAMDRPFSGKESISPGAFGTALDDMRTWDRENAVR